MELVIVSYANKNCNKYGSQVLYRAIKFARERDLDSDPEVLWHTITNGMVAQNSDMLVMAGLEDGKVIGHMIVRIVNNEGTLIALITQIEIDDDIRDGRDDVWEAGWPIIYQFARSKGATRVRCWAMNEKLAKLFTRFGFEPKDYVLMDIGLEVEDGTEDSSNVD